MARSLQILLVEDHLDTQQMMRRLLLAFGHGVHTAGCVKDALTVAVATPLDLVIADLGLPDGSGVDLMQQLKTQYGLKGIALTGYEPPGEAERRDAGFVAHLTKPVSFEKLEKLLAQVST